MDVRSAPTTAYVGDDISEGRDGLAFGAALLFALSMYASITNLIPALEVVRPALLTSSVAALALFVRRLANREPLPLDGWRGGALIALGLLAALSAKWSVYPEASHDTASELIKDVAIYLTVASVVSSAARLRWILLACLLGGLAPAWGSLQNYLDGTNLVEGFRARWEGVYADPNHLAMAMVFLVPVALTALLRGAWWERALGALSLLASCTTIVITHSRGGALGLTFAVLIWAVRATNRLRTLLAVLALLGAFAYAAPQSFWNRTETIADYQEDASALGRVHAWEVAAAISRDRPLLGVGAGAFVYAWPLYAPVDARGQAYVAHNVFLAVIGELGWIGFLFFLLFTGSALAGGFQAGRSDSTSGMWMRAVYAGACGYLLCDMSAGYINSAHFFFIFGLLGAGDRFTRAERRWLRWMTDSGSERGFVPAGLQTRV